MVMVTCTCGSNTAGGHTPNCPLYHRSVGGKVIPFPMDETNPVPPGPFVPPLTAQPRVIGWICPNCGRGLAPSTSYCPCRP